MGCVGTHRSKSSLAMPQLGERGERGGGGRGGRWGDGEEAGRERVWLSGACRSRAVWDVPIWQPTALSPHPLN